MRRRILSDVRVMSRRILADVIPLTKWGLDRWLHMPTGVMRRRILTHVIPLNPITALSYCGKEEDSYICQGNEEEDTYRCHSTDKNSQKSWP